MGERLVGMQGVAPFVAINFTSYEMLRQLAIDTLHEKPNLLMNLSIGALAGTIAMSITYPSELVRRRMMLQVRVH
jgi:solute carrier family 25 phosphate transporter 23/24/25/41